MNTINEQSNLLALKDINSIPIIKTKDVHVHEAIKWCARIVSKMPNNYVSVRVFH